MSELLQPYKPKNTIRIVTAASLFDGHDAAINVMRRIIQSTGVEVIHLGHNRSAQDVVDCAIEEDAQAIALTSYQGGHVEYFKYMYDLLYQKGAGHIKLFGGGGGTILPQEIEELHAYGIERIYSPDDGRSLGLQGMINDLVQKSDFETPVSFENEILLHEVKKKNPVAIAQAITMLERGQLIPTKTDSSIPVLGITGTGGAGKSSLTDELILRFLEDFHDKTIAVISVDPSKRKTGGALLGDRIRMNSVSSSRVYMRSFATREANIALNKNVHLAIDLLKIAGFDLIIVETAGIGQSDSEIITIADVSLYVMTPEYGAASQLEKIDMVDYADIIALNKFDKRGALDALRDVKKQYQRSHGFWNRKPDEMPVFGTIASQFNDPGTNSLYRSIIDCLNDKMNLSWKSSLEIPIETSKKIYIIPPERTRYLAEIAEESKRHSTYIQQQKTIARKLNQLKGAIDILEEFTDK
ncbi:MAG: cobalamin-dependent protein [Bacteroidetes bacterium]|nr:cobalamin-dependent protein [Bacteroidota bacterium]